MPFLAGKLFARSPLSPASGLIFVRRTPSLFHCTRPTRSATVVALSHLKIRCLGHQRVCISRVAVHAAYVCMHVAMVGGPRCISSCLHHMFVTHSGNPSKSGFQVRGKLARDVFLLLPCCVDILLYILNDSCQGSDTTRRIINRQVRSPRNLSGLRRSLLNLLDEIAVRRRMGGGAGQLAKLVSIIDGSGCSAN